MHAQEASIAPVRSQSPVLVRPYLPAYIPPVRLANSPRLRDLVRGGTLYLTAQDAIALALENNIDIEVSRYNPLLASWRLERAEAGGALPGVPSGASQAGSVASGQGLAGSQAAAGVSIAGTGNASNRTSNATISQIGPVTQNLDPIVQQATTFSHTTTPQPNLVQSQTSAAISSTHVYTATVQQGLLSGGLVTLNYSEHYLQENVPSDLLNPSVAPNLSLSVQHNLLRGFGNAVNARTITVSRMNLNMTDLNFKTLVIRIVSQVLNSYYSLAASAEDLRAKQNAAEVAQTFLDDVTKEVRIGSVAPTDQIDAESLSVTSKQTVVNAQVSLAQQEVSFKNLLSRTGILDPLLANIHIVPIDTIAIPVKDDIPTVDEMVKQAIANRADLEVERVNERAGEISALGTKNGILPTLQVFAAESHAGLAGTPHTVINNGIAINPDQYFVGGIGTGLGEVLRRNFPTERVGAFLQASIRNRQALADAAIDILQLRQTQLGTRRDVNQVEVDIRNYVVALQQARVRYEAAVQNRILQEQLWDAEQRRFRLGASTAYLVTQQQRDLVTAKSSEVGALVSYSNARVALDQALGSTLEANRISIAEARSGKIGRASSLPDPLPTRP
jgi:outer membrane protein